MIKKNKTACFFASFLGLTTLAISPTLTLSSCGESWVNAIPITCGNNFEKIFKSDKDSFFDENGKDIVSYLPNQVISCKNKKYVQANLQVYKDEKWEDSGELKWYDVSKISFEKDKNKSHQNANIFRCANIATEISSQLQNIFGQIMSYMTAILPDQQSGWKKIEEWWDLKNIDDETIKNFVQFFFAFSNTHSVGKCEALMLNHEASFQFSENKCLFVPSYQKDQKGKINLDLCHRITNANNNVDIKQDFLAEQPSVNGDTTTYKFKSVPFCFNNLRFVFSYLNGLDKKAENIDSSKYLSNNEQITKSNIGRSWINMPNVLKSFRNENPIVVDQNDCKPTYKNFQWRSSSSKITIPSQDDRLEPSLLSDSFILLVDYTIQKKGEEYTFVDWSAPVFFPAFFLKEFASESALYTKSFYDKPIINQKFVSEKMQELSSFFKEKNKMPNSSVEKLAQEFVKNIFKGSLKDVFLPFEEIK